MSVDALRGLFRDLHGLLPSGRGGATIVMARRESVHDGSSSAPPAVVGGHAHHPHTAVQSVIRMAVPELALRHLELNGSEQHPSCWVFVPGGPVAGSSEGLDTARGVNQQATGLLSGLADRVLARLGLLPRPSGWAEALLRMACHFPGRVAVERCRVLAARLSSDKDQLVKEIEVAQLPPNRRRQVYSGVVVSRLAPSMDFVTASAAGVRLVLDAADANERGERPAPDPGFASLHAAFDGSGRRTDVGVRWLRLHDPVLTPAVNTYAFRPRGLTEKSPPKEYVLARRDAGQVVCQLWGDGAGAFESLATAAGYLLPRWPGEPYPAALARPTELAGRIGGGEPSAFGDRSPPCEDGLMVTDHCGPLERWLAWVLTALARHSPRHLTVRLPPDGEADGCGGVVELAGVNPFAASALAIEASGLMPGGVGEHPPPLSPVMTGVLSSKATDNPTSRSERRPTLEPQHPPRSRPLTGREAAVLQALSRAGASRLIITELCQRLPPEMQAIHPKTVGRVLNGLCTSRPKLATRGKKPRSGAAITPAGQRALADHQRRTTR